MTSTFGDHLKLFALSVDILGEERFKRVNRLIEEYCRETLDIEFTKLFLSSDVDGNPGLKRYGLGVLEIENVRAIRNSDGGYNGQTSLAFDKRKPLWIVSATGKQLLENCDRFRDLWSGLKSIPGYRTTGGAEESGIRTSIIVPISGGDTVLGVLKFVTSEYIEITDEAKIELSTIAETMGMLIHLFRSAETQKTGTEEALENLQQLLSKPLPKLTKPKMFVASSARAEEDVIEVVLGVLKEKAYAERLDVVFWKAMDRPGNINRQLLDAIGSCRFGICYFSQKDGDGEYIDNINVVFEAGMFHGRVDEITPVPASWVPIRERMSPELPFDFAQERILWVDRTKEGGLKTKSFAAGVRASLDGLLSAG